MSEPHQGLPSSDDEDILADLGDSDEELSPNRFPGTHASPGRIEVPGANVTSPNRYLSSGKEMKSNHYEPKEAMKTVE